MDEAGVEEVVFELENELSVQVIENIDSLDFGTDSEEPFSHVTCGGFYGRVGVQEIARQIGDEVKAGVDKPALSSRYLRRDYCLSFITFLYGVFLTTGFGDCPVLALLSSSCLVMNTSRLWICFQIHHFTKRLKLRRRGTLVSRF